MSQAEFLDFKKDDCASYLMINSNKTMDRERKKMMKVRQSDIKMERFEKKDPFKMYFKYLLEDEEFQVATIG